MQYIVRNILRKQGFIVNDIDGWCRELYYRDDFLEVIKKHFPESFIDNKFNKRVLRNLVFDDVKKFGITEIRERRSLKVSKVLLLTGRYTRGSADEYKLYYIMQ